MMPRFEVDTQGMSQLHANRPPETIIRELVQNAFDEEAATCQLTIEEDPDGTMVTVLDDGPGFRDIRDAYTLMAETPKRMDPQKRGRFNLGEKEVICLARWASIETTGWTVDFPQEGGREIRQNNRKRGTRVSALMPWDEPTRQRLTERMKLLRPPASIQYLVNGETVQRREELARCSLILRTILQEHPGQPLRDTRRRTSIHILAPRGDTAWIYEMGIPVQETELPYDVDIMQKVPMPPGRDTVSPHYLQEISTGVLNTMHPTMEQKHFAETWTRTALENPRVRPEAVRTTVRQRYGNRAAISSRNREADSQAIDQGYQIIQPRSLSRKELQTIQETGAMQRTVDLFPNPVSFDDPNILIDHHGDPVLEAFAQWVVMLGECCGKKVIPAFVYQDGTNMAANCTINTRNPEMRFNTRHLNEQWFRERGEEQLALVIHELGHAHLNGETSHGPQWGRACTQVGAMIALRMPGPERSGYVG